MSIKQIKLYNDDGNSSRQCIQVYGLETKDPKTYFEMGKRLSMFKSIVTSTESPRENTRYQRTPREEMGYMDMDECVDVQVDDASEVEIKYMGRFLKQQSTSLRVTDSEFTFEKSNISP